MLIDTHCHLGGCISPEFVWRAIQATGQGYLADTLDDVKTSMVFGDSEDRNFDRFLDKFKMLNLIKWTPDLIKEAINDAAVQLRENDYTLLSMSIEKYLCVGWHKTECVKFIKTCFDEVLPGKVGLLLGLKYEYTKTMLRQHASLIDDPEMYSVFAGLDFVGNERMIDLSGLAPVLSSWSDKIVRLHVGETTGDKLIDTVIHVEHVNRLAHAIGASRESRMYIKDNGIAVDMCLSSNFFTGTCPSFAEHPISRFIEDGVEVTLGSDDPIQFRTDLAKEYRIAAKSGIDTSVVIRNSRRLLPTRAG